MELSQQELQTIPNALVIARFIAAPLVAHELYEDPAEWWLKTAAFMATDNLDGFLAKLEDKSPLLAQLGCRRTKFGAMADPIADRWTGAWMIGAGINNGVIPKRLGYAAIAQKAFSSTTGLIAHKKGHTIEVSKLGKRSEFATNLGLGMLFAAESVEDPLHQKQLQTVSKYIAAVGIAGATANTANYIHEYLLAG